MSRDTHRYKMTASWDSRSMPPSQVRHSMCSFRGNTNAEFHGQPRLSLPNRLPTEVVTSISTSSRVGVLRIQLSALQRFAYNHSLRHLRSTNIRVTMINPGFMIHSLATASGRRQILPREQHKMSLVIVYVSIHDLNCKCIDI